MMITAATLATTEPAARIACPDGVPGCQAAEDVGDLLGGATGGLAEAAAESAIDKLAQAFGTAAGNTLSWLWTQLDAATSVNLSDPAVRQPMVFTGAFALVLLVALFVIQLTASALRQDPGGLARAVKGLLVGSIGCAAAVAITQLSLTAVDAMSKGVVQATTGKENAGALGKKLLAFQAAQGMNPIGLMLVSTIVMVASVVVWASLMVRKVLILVSVVFAAIAFAGGGSDYTSSWVRKWIEVVVALVFSKFVIVVIMSLGYNMFVHADSGSLDGASMLAAGVVILLLAGLAPFMALKLVSFAGDGLHHHLRSASGGAAAAGRTITSAPQKAMSASRMVSSSSSTSRNSSSSPAGQSGQAGRAQAPRPTPQPAMAGAGAGASAGGAAGGSVAGGSAAGGSAAGAAGGPAGLAAVAAVGAGKAACPRRRRSPLVPPQSPAAQVERQVGAWADLRVLRRGRNQTRARRRRRAAHPVMRCPRRQPSPLPQQVLCRRVLAPPRQHHPHHLPRRRRR